MNEFGLPLTAKEIALRSEMDTILKIAQLVCDIYGVDVEQALNKGPRTGKRINPVLILKARAVFVWLARKNGFTLNQIGNVMYRNDSFIRRISSQVDNERFPGLKQEASNLLKQMYD